MSKRKASVLPASLSKAKRRFEKWRNRNKPRSRLPAELWSTAVELAREHGVNLTAKTLHLDYYSLKKRIGADTGRAPEFVELLHGIPAASAPRCTIEIEDCSGGALRMHVHGAELPDLAAIARAFRGDGS